MKSRVLRIMLWLFVIDLGIALGAGLYEARIVLPDWIDPSSPSPVWHAEAARRDDTGRRFWVAVTTVPLTLLTLANAVAAWRASGAVRRWWLAAATISLAERAFTLAYFIPTMIGLTQAASSPEAVSEAIRWANLNHLRHVLTLAAWLAALKAFSLLYSYAGGAHRAAGSPQRVARIE